MDGMDGKGFFYECLHKYIQMYIHVTKMEEVVMNWGATGGSRGDKGGVRKTDEVLKSLI